MKYGRETLLWLWLWASLLPNVRDQQLAANGFSIPQDVIAILLHRLVRPSFGASKRPSRRPSH